MGIYNLIRFAIKGISNYVTNAAWLRLELLNMPFIATVIANET